MTTKTATPTMEKPDNTAARARLEATGGTIAREIIAYADDFAGGDIYKAVTDLSDPHDPGLLRRDARRIGHLFDPAMKLYESFPTRGETAKEKDAREQADAARAAERLRADAEAAARAQAAQKKEGARAAVEATRNEALKLAYDAGVAEKRYGIAWQWARKETSVYTDSEGNRHDLGDARVEGIAIADCLREAAENNGVDAALALAKDMIASAVKQKAYESRHNNLLCRLRSFRAEKDDIRRAIIASRAAREVMDHSMDGKGWYDASFHRELIARILRHEIEQWAKERAEREAKEKEEAAKRTISHRRAQYSPAQSFQGAAPLAHNPFALLKL